MSLEGCAQIDTDGLRIGVLHDGHLALLKRFDWVNGKWLDETPRFWPEKGALDQLWDIQKFYNDAQDE